MIYFAKLKDGRAYAFNSKFEIQEFEAGWRGIPSSWKAKEPGFFEHLIVYPLGRDERKLADGAKFEDYVTVFSMSDDAVQPPKPKRQPAKRKDAALAHG